jgi:hypothetical protein
MFAFVLLLWIASNEPAHLPGGFDLSLGVSHLGGLQTGALACKPDEMAVLSFRYRRFTASEPRFALASTRMVSSGLAR